MAGFFDVERHGVHTSGGEVELPILYYDVSVFYAYFVLEAERAAALLPEGLAPVWVAPGRTVGGLAFYVYRDTSIGPYNEVGLALAAQRCERPVRLPLFELVRPAARRRLGYYIVDLPVTTAVANAAGRELWGYPKFVTELPLSIAAARFSGQVDDPDGGEPILTLEGRPDPGPTLPASDLVLFSVQDDKLVRTIVHARGSTHTTGGRSFRLHVGNSGHVMAQHLRDLGLDGKAPLVVQHCSHLQTRLPAGEVVGRVGPAT